MRKKKHDCRFRFCVPYENGTLTSVAYDAQGMALGIHRLATAGEEAVFSAKLEGIQTMAKGLMHIRVAYTDCGGTVKPAEHQTLTVEITGGTLLAFGNEGPFQTRPFYTNQMETYYGEVLAIVLAEGNQKSLFSCTDGEHRTEVTIQ